MTLDEAERLAALGREVQRFMAYVELLPSGCWYWTGGRSRGKGNRKWYGTFWANGRTVRAHRFICEAVGKLCPAGHHRDHTCLFSMCVNPDHLEVVTKEENQRRKIARRLSNGGLSVGPSGGQVAG